jgi:alpha-N-arabinofuranosidase
MAQEGAHAARLVVSTTERGPVLSRYLQGHFAEHLGRGIYDGVWVGPDSAIPNTRGFRDDVVAALRELEVPVVRWPGGCFADEYHWRDGIGPRAERPVRINTHWGRVAESNAVGTHEFMDLMELIGADAYIAGNLGSGSPREMAEWREYMTADGESSLAALRRANGRAEPWRVAFWGVGNESWGCGGNLRPEFYADLYRRYATFLKSPEGNRPQRVASGGHSDLTVWTRVLSSTASGLLNGISHHYYTLPTGDWSKKGAAVGFPEAEWISTLARTLLLDDYLRANVTVLEESDPEGRIGLYLDEWGTWYDPDPADEGGILYQQSTLRDAVVAALNLHLFHRHAGRLHMANIAQMVNVLQAVVLTRGADMVLTPTYHAFRMHLPFQDATGVAARWEGELPSYELGETRVPALSATAAIAADGRLVLSLVNLDPHRRASVALHLADPELDRASGQVLTAAAMDAHNTFEAPAGVIPREYSAAGDAGEVTLELPPKSVVVVSLTGAAAN